MKKLNLLTKLLLLTLVPMITILALITSISYKTEIDELEHSISEFRNALMKERKQELKEVTEVALGIVTHQKSLPGQGDIESALRDIRFGSAGYFYIYNTKGVNIFHAVKPQLQGKELIGLTDSKGTKLIVGLLDAAQNGDGTFSYYYQKPGEEAQIEKLGYAIMVPGTDWMLGTGAYLDDIEKVVNEYALNAEESLYAKMLFMLITAVVLIIVTIIIIYFAAARIVAMWWISG